MMTPAPPQPRLRREEVVLRGVVHADQRARGRAAAQRPAGGGRARPVDGLRGEVVAAAPEGRLTSRAPRRRGLSRARGRRADVEVGHL